MSQELLRPRKEPNVKGVDEIAVGDKVDCRLWQRLDDREVYFWTSGVVESIEGDKVCVNIDEVEELKNELEESFHIVYVNISELYRKNTVI